MLDAGVADRAALVNDFAAVLAEAAMAAGHHNCIDGLVHADTAVVIVMVLLWLNRL